MCKVRETENPNWYTNWYQDLESEEIKYGHATYKDYDREKKDSDKVSSLSCLPCFILPSSLLCQ